MRPGQLEFWRIGNKARTSSTSSAGRADLLRHREGRQPAEPGRRRPKRCSCRPASGSRCWSTGRRTAPTGCRTQRSTPARPATSIPGSCSMTVVSKGSPVPDRSRCRRSFPPLTGSAQRARSPASDHRLRRYRESEPVHINGKPYTPNCVDTIVNARRRRGVDDREHGAGSARVPHPPARLPGDRDQRRARTHSPAIRTSSRCPPPATPIRRAS